MRMNRTFKLANRLIYYTLVYLDKNGATSLAQLTKDIKNDLKFDAWESVIYKKTGSIRWEQMLLSFSLDLTKAEWITKKRKIWMITPQGHQALKKLKEPSKLREEATRLYKIWNATPREELLRRKAEAKKIVLQTV